MTKKNNAKEEIKLSMLTRAKSEVQGFSEMIYRFERTMSVFGRSQQTFKAYANHVAAISLHFGKIPTELKPEQVHDYLFFLQKEFKSPSQSYFKHTVYGLRFLLKSENLSYEFLRLPEIKSEKKFR